LSRINNSVAVHHAVRMHQQSGQIARQNTSRLLRVNRAQVAELVQQVVEVGPTTEDLQRFIDIISQEVEDPGLEFAQVEAEIRETTPFAGVLQFLSSSQNRTELVAYLGLLLVVIQTVLMLTQSRLWWRPPTRWRRLSSGLSSRSSATSSPSLRRLRSRTSIRNLTRDRGRKATDRTQAAVRPPASCQRGTWITEDGPYPRAEVGAIAATCEHHRSRRPCHPRAISSGHERYPADNHGHSQ
jgi:hypothetical protein